MNWKNWLPLLLILVLVACGDANTTKQTNETTQNELESQEETTEQVEEEIEKTNETNETEDTSSLPTIELQKMDEGEEVEKLQKALEELGYTIPTDGVYSEATTWAITDFQLQSDNLLITGVYDEATRLELEEKRTNEETIEAGVGLAPIAEPATTDSGSLVLGNPYDQLAIINKSQALPEDYEPVDLVVPDVTFPFEEDVPKKQLRKPAAIALEELFEEAKANGHYLYAQSGYRSYERQVALFEAYTNEHGEEAANEFSARPGESEHQSGLSMDVSSESVNFELTTEFGETPEGIWVRENAHRFGFIIRYPEGKENITEYQYEPWHLRYVGKRAAEEMYENDWTLEEYFQEVEKE